MSQESEGKKRGMFSRLFGGGQSAPAPEAAPEAAPQEAAQAAPEAPPADEKRSWWSRLSGGLSRTSQAITQGVADVFTKRKLDALTLEELEDVLLRADLGVGAATRITEAVGKARYERDIEPEEVREILAREVERVLAPVAQPLVVDDSKSPFIILVVGVNGSGKTTTIAKLASRWTGEGKTVVLAAGDTFRAAAVEQLKVWGDRLGAEVTDLGILKDDPAVLEKALIAAARRGPRLARVDALREEPADEAALVAFCGAGFSVAPDA